MTDPPRSDAAVDAGTPDDGGTTMDAGLPDAGMPVASWPAWRRAMERPDTLYFVTPRAPGWTRDLLREPLPTHFGATEQNTSFGAGWDVMSGYSSGTLLEEVGGPHGTMVYGTGGHTRLQNQLLGLDLNDDAPEFFWWQQPQFETSRTEGAELYFNRDEFNALPANRRLGADESVANWDGGFPVGFDGWIFPAPLTTGQLGRGAPHGFRYSNTCYVPASVTGADGQYFCCLGPQGPFAQSWRPGGSTNAAWLHPDARFGADGRRWPYYLKNVRTGAWTEHRWQPDLHRYGFTGQTCGVFRDQRRVYVSADEAGRTAGWWSLDFSRGLAGLSRSEWFVPAQDVAPNRYACGAWTDGHPEGRHLVFFPDLLNPGGLIVQDFDRNEQRRLDVGQGLAIPTNDERVGMSYDPRRHRVLVLLTDAANGLSYFSISIPPNHLDATAYRVERRPLTVADPTMQAQLSATTGFYRKTALHPTLGIILVPFDRARMLAFVPA